MILGVDTTFLVQVEILEAPEHAAALAYLQREVLEKDVKLALAPQVLAEFVHVVTDPRRWERPLAMEAALVKAQFWWNAEEVERVFPTPEATALFFEWMSRYHLGRKRLLDTQLAATLWSAGIRVLITSNARDYKVLGLEAIVPHA
jgi:predicted nucleic acid-binding protein